jgi:hypothetical protein
MKQITVTGCENCPMHENMMALHYCNYPGKSDCASKAEYLFEHCPLKTEPITITLNPTNNESNPNQ